MTLPERYEKIIGQIVELCPAPDKFAHTYAGMAIYLAAAIITRKSLRSPWSLMSVVVFEVANEYVDRVANGSWRWHDTLGDAAATWFWPIVIFCTLRARPRLGI